MISYKTNRGGNKLKFSTLLILLLSLIPIIDTINGLMIKGSNLSGIGSLYRLIVFFVAIILMITSRITKNTMIYLLSFVLFLAIQYAVSTGYINESMELTVKLFTPIFIIALIPTIRRRVPTVTIARLFDWLSIIFPLSILLPFTLHMGYSTYAFGIGYKAYYYATNEISFAIVVMVMYVWQKLREELNGKYLLRFVLNGMVCLLLGSKIALGIFVFFVFLYALLFVIENKRKITLKKLVMVVGIIVSVLIAIRVLHTQIDSVIGRWLYNHSSAESTIAFLTSHRNVYISIGWKEFKSGGVMMHLFGWGLGGINNGMKFIEMDLIDILFCTGIVGTIILVAIYASLIKQIRLKTCESKLFLLIGFALSFLGGHVLFTGLGGMSLGLLFLYVDTINRRMNTDLKQRGKVQFPLHVLNKA